MNIDRERINHIIFVTNKLHDAVDALYEALCDEEDEEAMKVLVVLEVEVKLLKDSFETD